MTEGPPAKKMKHDLRENKAHIMLAKAAEGGYAVPGVCVVSLPLQQQSIAMITANRTHSIDTSN